MQIWLLLSKMIEMVIHLGVPFSDEKKYGSSYMPQVHILYYEGMS